MLLEQLLVLAQIEGVQPLIHFLFRYTWVIPWAVVPQTQHEFDEASTDEHDEDRTQPRGYGELRSQSHPHAEIVAGVVEWGVFDCPSGEKLIHELILLFLIWWHIL